MVVSSPAYHRARPDLLLLAITSQVRSPLGIGEAMIVHWQQAGLVKPSVLKPVLTTVEKGFVIKKLGHLVPADREMHQEVLATILGS